MIYLGYWIAVISRFLSMITAISGKSIIEIIDDLLLIIGAAVFGIVMTVSIVALRT